MDVISYEPFWVLKNGLRGAYPTLRENTVCDVLIVGGGISGALVAHALKREQINVVLIDKDDIGRGSTSGSTALLQYEIDKTLVELGEILGSESAARAYRSCHASIEQLESIAAELQVSSFSKRPSLYLAGDEKDVEHFQKEAVLRRQLGIEVEFLDSEKLQERFALQRPAALLSEQGAQVDPYSFAHALIEESVRHGLRVYDRSSMKELGHESGQVVARMENGASIHCQHLIFTMGYDAYQYLPKSCVQLHSSYAFVSKPIPEQNFWPMKALIWEHQVPYLYMRSTDDHRILVGGEDENFKNAALRDALIPRKTQTLLKKFRTHFPQIEIEAAYSWAGTFGETPDGLPCIGTLAEYPGCYFSCGFGGNGITYSMIAAEMFRDLVRGKIHPLADLYSFTRRKNHS